MVLEKKETYISPSQRKRLDIKEYSRVSDSSNSNKKKEDFYAISRAAKEHVYNVYDQKIEERSNGSTKEDYVEIYHNAMLGIPSAVNHMKKIIEAYLLEHGLRSVSFPYPYKTLVEAIFEEEFGWGVLSAYKHEMDCEAAQVIGVDVSFKRENGWELQDFRFRNLTQVFELTQRFANMHTKTLLNEHTNTELETLTHDNIRVSIMIPGRTHEEPSISLRRKVVKELNFESMVKYKTIPKEAVPIFEALAKFKVNSVIAGPPGCGKSTMLQAFLSSTLYEMRNGVKVPERINTVYVEKFLEWAVRSLHPHSHVRHVLGSGKDFEHTILPRLLRKDVSRIVIGEIREHEVGLYKRASVQGIKQLMGTLHDLDPVDIPEIMCDLYMQYYTNGINHEAVQKSFNKNIHFAISMDEFLTEEDIFVKKVTGIHIYEPINEGLNVKLYTIMDYDQINDTWSYNAELPERFTRMVSKYDLKKLIKFQEQLSELEKSSSKKEVSYTR